MSFRYIHKVVGEFQEPDTALAIQHEDDLKYTALVLHNALAKGLKVGGYRGSCTKLVLETSKFIKETATMKEMMRDDEEIQKEGLKELYLNEIEQYRIPYRIPAFISSFKQFRTRKGNRVKDAAVAITTKMYRLHRIDLRRIAKGLGEVVKC
jgi:hypothetical protein